VSTRPLERLPTIRAKLGSTIVFAVGMTVLLIFLMLGYALRGSAHDSDRLQLLAIARRSASEPPGTLPLPPGVSVLRLNEDVAVGQVPAAPRVGGETLPVFADQMVHIGATATGSTPWFPSSSRPCGRVGLRSAVRASPGPDRGHRRDVPFLFEFWWQFLVAGLLAAGIALVIARWLARGMTQPLRDMAAAARRMETGDYAGRVQTKSRDEVGRLATAFNRMSAELENLEQSRRDLVANVSHELKTPIAAIRPISRTCSTASSSRLPRRSRSC